jgi:phosphoglucomutase
MIRQLKEKLPSLPGHTFTDTGSDAICIESADDFQYIAPVDYSETKAQGVRIYLSNGGRIVYRLSGTGTQGATLRVYLDCYQNDKDLLAQETQEALNALIQIAEQLAGIQKFTGRTKPDVIT